VAVCRRRPMPRRKQGRLSPKMGSRASDVWVSQYELVKVPACALCLSRTAHGAAPSSQRSVLDASDLPTLKRLQIAELGDAAQNSSRLPPVRPRVLQELQCIVTMFGT
jgi:hypothetical protein